MDMSLMEVFSNPETIDSLTFGQKMQASLITMLMGLGLTFLVLIFILIFIKVMGKMIRAGQKKTAAPSAPAPVPVAETAKAENDEALVAVIAAAIAAYEGDSGSNLVVTKITRLSGAQTPWTVAGMTERMETRKLY